MHIDHYMYLRVERRDPNEHLQNLVPVSKGPDKVGIVDYKTVVIEKMDRSVKNVSCSRVVLAPKPKSKEGMESNLKPTAVALWLGTVEVY